MNELEHFGLSEVPEGYRSGFVGIVGVPNAGKSTLINRLTGEKIAITSEKPQTTRNRILGVVHRETSQMVFFDTPGVHKSEKELNSRIVDAALSVIPEVDVVLYVADATKQSLSNEALILDKLKKAKKPVVLALNKVDAMRKDDLLLVLDQWNRRFDFADIIPISALKGDQVEALAELLESKLPEGPPFFSEDMLTDVPERFLVAELVREKVFRLTGDEIPYSVAVTIDAFNEATEKDKTEIHAAIHVERDSQKGIIIGKGGKTLKRIGMEARKDVERLLGEKVNLRLFVRVQKNWTRDTRALRKFGY